MLEPDITRDAVRFLGDAIAAILEDTAPMALKPASMTAEDYAAMLLATGEDIRTLAAAIGVLTRRAGAA